MDLLISWFFFGSLVGATASFIEITPSRQHFLVSLLTGIIGAVVGGVLGYQISQNFNSGDIPPILYMFLTSVFLVLVPKSYKKAY